MKQGFPNSTQGGCIQTAYTKLYKHRISLRLYVGIKWYKYIDRHRCHNHFFTSHVEWIKCMPRAQNCLQILVEWLHYKPNLILPQKVQWGTIIIQLNSKHVGSIWRSTGFDPHPAVLAAASTGRRHWHTTVERSSSLHGLGVCHSLRKQCANHHPFQHLSTILNHWIFCCQGKHQGEVATRTLLVPTMRPGTANFLQTWRRDVGWTSRKRGQKQAWVGQLLLRLLSHEWVDGKRWRKYLICHSTKNTKLLSHLSICSYLEVAASQRPIWPIFAILRIWLPSRFLLAAPQYIHRALPHADLKATYNAKNTVTNS